MEGNQPRNTRNMRKKCTGWLLSAYCAYSAAVQLPCLFTCVLALDHALAPALRVGARGRHTSGINSSAAIPLLTGRTRSAVRRKPDEAEGMRDET